jgi:two-component system invasion response regulator UvrY
MNAFLVVDDHSLVRRAVARMLSLSFPNAVIGEAANARETVRALEAQPWDLLIMDVGLPDRNGLDVLDDVKRIQPQLPVLLLTGMTDDAIAIRGFEKGAKGFLCKDCSMDELGAAVRRLMDGGRYVPGALAEKLAAKIGAPQGSGTPAAPQEIEGRLFDVLLRLGHGDTVKAIAADMGLSVETVETYRTRLLEQLCMKSDADIVRYCRIYGFVC